MERSQGRLSGWWVLTPGFGEGIYSTGDTEVFLELGRFKNHRLKTDIWFYRTPW